MIYLGVHNGGVAGATLIKDGVIVGAVSEERFCRIKNYHGWPEKSIDYLLNISNLSLKDIDKIVYGVTKSALPDEVTFGKILRRVIDGCSENIDIKEKYFARVITEIDWNKRHLKEVNDWAESNSVKDKLVFIEHHHSHAAGAYYMSPFEDSMVFTIDGKGDFKTNCVWKEQDGELKLLDFSTTFDSIGYLYGNITKALGFRAERHEGKVTGLAAYGDANKFSHITDEILKFEDGDIKLKMGKYYLPWFLEESDVPDFYNEVKKHKREDVAAAIQNTVENVVTSWIDYKINQFNDGKPVNVCLAGGVTANVKMNQRIRELKNVKNVYVLPPMDDCGLSLGSCLAQMARDGNPYKKFVNSMSFGPSFSNEQIETILNDKKYKYKRIESVEHEITDAIESGKIIGFFSGGMEYGPRALCNRSIIYHCRDGEINTWLNDRLSRTEFMPFAPVTTNELAEKCFIGWSDDDRAADFMTMTYDVTKEFAESCPAAVHIDNTARPQIVRKDVDRKMYDIITHYHKVTGDLALINTSFNNHEEPIVCSIEDALKSLDRKNVDILFIEDFIVFPNKVEG